MFNIVESYKDCGLLFLLHSNLSPFQIFHFTVSIGILGQICQDIYKEYTYIHFPVLRPEKTIM